MTCPKCNKEPVPLLNPYTDETIIVSNCISETIEELFENEYEILSCNCNHAEKWPTLVLPENYTADMVRAVMVIIAKISKRPWDIFIKRGTDIVMVSTMNKLRMEEFNE